MSTLKIRIFCLPVVFVLFSLMPCQAQKDTVKVLTLYEYMIEDGKATDKKFVKEQITYTNDEREIRRIVFKPRSAEIEKYCWYFYTREGKLLKEERYNGDDGLQAAIRYNYSDEGQKIGGMHYQLTDKNELALHMTETFLYDLSGKILSETASYANNKRAYSRIYKYDEPGSIIKYVCKSAGKEDFCEVKKAKSKHVYNTEGKLITTEEKLKMADGTKKKVVKNREYNDKGYLKQITLMEASKQTTHIEERYTNGYISERMKYTENGEIISKEEYTYLIHYVYQVMPVPRYLKE